MYQSFSIQPTRHDVNLLLPMHNYHRTSFHPNGKKSPEVYHTITAVTFIPAFILNINAIIIATIFITDFTTNSRMFA